MTNDEILANIEEDSVLDIKNLEYHSNDIPRLYSKWYGILTRERESLIKGETILDRITNKKYLYYTSRGTDEDYKKNRLHFTLTKAEAEQFMLADTELRPIYNEVQIQRQKVSLIEDFIKTLNGRSFNIKNAIEFLKLKEGN